MYLQNIKNIKKIKSLNDSNLATLAGVSRAAVHRWFAEIETGDWVNVETATVIRLADSLHLDPSFFLRKRKYLEPHKTQFLWDALYPDLESFCLALTQNQKPALARLVQVLGFHEACFVAGKKVLTEFERYKKFIKPVRCKQLEVLWPLYFQTSKS